MFPDATLHVTNSFASNVNPGSWRNKMDMRFPLFVNVTRPKMSFFHRANPYVSFGTFEMFEEHALAR